MVLGESKFGNRSLSFLIVLSLLLLFSLSVLSSKSFALSQAKITFTFDDGRSTQYLFARPALAKGNIPGVAYVATGPVSKGEPWVMNWAQLRELQNVYRWEIGSHSVSHPTLTTLSTRNVKRELQNSKRAFESQGLTVKSFATPYGDYDDRVLSLIAQYYQSHRAAWGGNNFFPFNDYLITAREV